MPKDKHRKLPNEIHQAHVKGGCKLHLHLKLSLLEQVDSH